MRWEKKSVTMGADSGVQAILKSYVGKLRVTGQGILPSLIYHSDTHRDLPGIILQMNGYDFNSNYMFHTSKYSRITTKLGIIHLHLVFTMWHTCTKSVYLIQE